MMTAAAAQWMFVLLIEYGEVIVCVETITNSSQIQPFVFHASHGSA